jgi:hypothetical protein
VTRVDLPQLLIQLALLGLLSGLQEVSISPEDIEHIFLFLENHLNWDKKKSAKKLETFRRIKKGSKWHPLVYQYEPFHILQVVHLF